MISSSDITILVSVSLPCAVVLPIVFRSAGRAEVALEKWDPVIEQDSGSEGLSSSDGRYGLPKLASGPYAE